MKCCGCGKNINLDNTEIKDGEALWYGVFRKDVCIKAICNPCIKDKTKKAEYMKWE